MRRDDPATSGLLVHGTDWETSEPEGETLISLRGWFEEDVPVTMVAETESGRRFEVMLSMHKGYLDEMDPDDFETHVEDYADCEQRELLPTHQRIGRISCRRTDATVLSIGLERETIRLFERDGTDPWSTSTSRW